jgi:CheY-like chemotaxis protein
VVADLKKTLATRYLPLLVYTERDLNAEERERLRLGPTRYLTKSRSTDQEFVSCVLDMLAASQAKETA